MPFYKCTVCGKTFTRSESYVKKYNPLYCGQTCRAIGMHEQAQERRTARKAGIELPIKRKPLYVLQDTAERRLPHEAAVIVITEDIPVWPQYRPRKGRKYNAEKYKTGSSAAGYVVTVGGKRVCVRQAECVEI